MKHPGAVGSRLLLVVSFACFPPAAGPAHGSRPTSEDHQTTRRCRPDAADGVASVGCLTPGRILVAAGLPFCSSPRSPDHHGDEFHVCVLTSVASTQSGGLSGARPAGVICYQENEDAFPSQHEADIWFRAKRLN